MTLREESMTLFSESERVPDATLQGYTRSNRMLRSQIMEEASLRVCAGHSIKNPVCFVALCTKTKPFSRSRTWASFSTLTGADLVIWEQIAGGCVVPMAFENEWPFTVFDPIEPHVDHTAEVLERRMRSFFSTHRYRKIVAAFLPRKAQRALLSRVCAGMGIELAIVPTPLQWAQFMRLMPSRRMAGKKSRWYVQTHGPSMYAPLCHPIVREWAQKEINR